MKKWELSANSEETQIAESQTLMCVLSPLLTVSRLRIEGKGSFQMGHDHLDSWR